MTDPIMYTDKGTKATEKKENIKTVLANKL